MSRPPTDAPRGPAPLLARPAARLFLTSLTLLFVELLLIRWIPANVVYVGYFTNFLLMGSFLGIGLGILIGRRLRAPLSPFGPVLFAVTLLVLGARLDVQVRSTEELFFGLAESQRADTNFLVLPLTVALVTLVMAALALPLGGLLRSMPPLRAYAVDILGALAGVTLFASLSALGTPPAAWFGAAAILAALLGLGARLTAWSAVGAATVALTVLVVAVVHSLSAGVWSPYYRIGFWADEHRTEGLSVNGIPHQLLYAHDAPGRQPFYDQAYRWFPDRRFERVLVIGAGVGNDVTDALRHGARQVDAVEIDPRILDIGVSRHPDHPYEDQRVRRHVQDGRAFLRATSERYDLVVYALPDSLTLVSSTANLRLESFLFTVEAFADVRAHLASDGLFVVYNFFREPWLVQKLAAMLEDAFGAPPVVHTYPELGRQAAILATGPLVMASPERLSADRDEVDLRAAPPPATDDWPFLYLRDRRIPAHYLLALGLVLIATIVAVSGAAAVNGGGARHLSPHFFALGAAFLLLETRSLATFGLLFGTTWWVNALVFAAILASVLLAILVNMRVRFASPRWLYLGLFGSLAVAYVLPPSSLLFEPAWLRYVMAGALAFAPVFFANLVFSYSFRDTRAADLAFASNLLGALVGGTLEYVALLVGFQQLLLLVAVLYALAYLLAERWRFFADRALEPALAMS